MRITFVLSSYYPLWGGTEGQVKLQAAALQARGHHVAVLTWRHDEAWPSTEVIDGVTVIRIDRGNGRILRQLRPLLALVTGLVSVLRQSDIVVARQLNLPAYVTSVLSAFIHTPLVVIPATVASRSGVELNRARGRGTEARLRRLCLLPARRMGTAVGMSLELAQDLRNLGFKRVVRIPNGVVDAALPDRVQVRRELLAPHDVSPAARVVVAAGRYYPVKGFDLLIDAWPEVVRKRSDAVLLLVGDGPEEANLRRQVTAHGISASVRFVRGGSRTRDYLSVADVVVMPSRFEGFSNVLLEAMIAGVPVISTAVSGAVDLIRDGENGRIVPLENISSLSRAILEVLLSPGELGMKARVTVLACCELGRVVDEYERLFADLSGSPLSRPELAPITTRGT